MEQSRRTFIKSSSQAMAAGFLPTLSKEALSLDKLSVKAKQGYKLYILATNWGFNGTMDQFCAAAKKEGYDGIEVWWSPNEKEQEALFSAVKKHDLQVGFLCGGYQSDWKEHLDYFKKAITAAATNKFQKPLYINCHSGRDHFSFEQNNAFIDFTNQVAKETLVNIYHETHRSRMLFAAHIAKQFITHNPQLRLTLDISHWCNVHESLLEDQKETVALALERVGHIHARVGHQEGPQVNDPRAPEWAQAVKQHFEWWDKVVERKKKNGETMTILTEFGPPNYLSTLPYTQQPVANQWEINVHMMKLLKERYQ